MLELLKILIPLLIAVESGGDPNAYNEIENAAGILQIRPIMVDEVNRILGEVVYTLQDRFDIDKSLEMCVIYYLEHGRGTMSLRELDALWCAGPDGYEQLFDDEVAAHWDKILAEQERRNE